MKKEKHAKITELPKVLNRTYAMGNLKDYAAGEIISETFNNYLTKKKLNPLEVIKIRPYFKYAYIILTVIISTSVLMYLYYLVTGLGKNLSSQLMGKLHAEIGFLLFCTIMLFGQIILYRRESYSNFKAIEKILEENWAELDAAFLWKAHENDKENIVQRIMLKIVTKKYDKETQKEILLFSENHKGSIKDVEDMIKLTK